MTIRRELLHAEFDLLKKFIKIRALLHIDLRATNVHTYCRTTLGIPLVLFVRRRRRFPPFHRTGETDPNKNT